MRHLARQFLRLFLVVAAIGVSGVNGYAAVLSAFDIHAHGHHGAHSHPSHDEHGVDLHEDHAAIDQAQQDGDSSSTDQPCGHVHVHCCSSVAVATGEWTLALAVYTRAIAPIARSHLPPGQLASPLFRPPRVIA
jgi:hypothetical protein